MHVRDAVIIDVLRTPLARQHGDLSGWHPVDLLAEVLRGIERRTGVDPALVEDVIAGCVTQVGGQSTNIARNSVLAAGWPETVSGTTVDRQCGSSQQAVAYAAQAVMSGVHEVVVAAGVELMSSVPMFSNAGGDPVAAYGPQMRARYDTGGGPGGGLVPQGIAAERVAEEWALAREELDAFAVRSHGRAGAARAAGRFAQETLPVERCVRDRGTGEVTRSDALVVDDTGIRDTSPAALAGLPPVFLPGGRITAGNSSQISDGAAAALIMSADRAAQLGLAPIARVAGLALAGDDPVRMLTAPIPATERLLDRAGLTVDDIDRFEVNEAFAPVVLAWQRETGADLERVNVNGGAIALGHPLGASGVRLLATLVHELRRSGGRLGLQTMCEGGGIANATLVEAL